MKKILIGFMALGLILGTQSCKEAKEEEAHEHEHSHDGGEMHSHEHDDDHHGEEGHEHEHSHDGGEMHSHEHDGDHHDDEKEMQIKSLVVAMGSKSGSNVTGTITLTQSGDEVNMVANLDGLEPGSHAIHVHENGDCSSDDGKSAGGHWNPTDEDHGKWGENMYHMGDIGNLEADDKGNASISFSTDKWCLGCDDENKNVIGKSFIVHAKADDFESQPSGAAGARVACGVIEE
ncbi:MAG: superoxide dismutase family protein [Nonlabens sp.]